MAEAPVALAEGTRGCHSHPVSPEGRPVLFGVAVLTAMALASVGGSGGAPAAHAAAKKKPPVFFSKARLRTDGLMTPGQNETVLLSKLPPKADFKLALEPPPTTLQCGELYFCNIVKLFPAVGTLPFRSTAEGRASATFLMPSGYTLQSDPFDKRTRRGVTFMNGQATHINVFSTKNTRKERRLAFGFGRAIVQLP